MAEAARRSACNSAETSLLAAVVAVADVAVDAVRATVADSPSSSHVDRYP